MKFNYVVCEYSSIDINFEDLYLKILEEEYDNEPEIPVYDVYLEFIDNIEYWIQSLYAPDFMEYENEGVCEDIVDAWEAYLREQYGENWDEV
jgi:hypothetical protein